MITVRLCIPLMKHFESALCLKSTNQIKWPCLALHVSLSVCFPEFL